MSPSPSIGLNCFVIKASGMLKIKPTRSPFNQPVVGMSRLKIMKPMENLLVKDAIIALALSSNVIKNIGIIETIPNTNPAISPFSMFVIVLLFKCVWFF